MRTPRPDLEHAETSTLPAGDVDGPMMSRLAWAFVGLGLLLRLVRLTLNHPLWGDEAYLAVNVLTRDWSGLTRPLDYAQVAPMPFLMIEKGLVSLLGPSEFALRLFPTICGMIALVLFHHLARLWLRGPAVVLAVGILAVSHYPIRHGGEAKPYASDLLLAVGLLTLASHALRQPRRSGWVWALALAVPVSVSLSLPSLFLVAAIGLTLIVAWARRPDRSATQAMVAFATTALLGTAVAWWLVQRAYPPADVMEVLMRDWRHAGAFPPGRIVEWPLWFLRNHTSHMFAYPVGGANGLSVLTTAAFFVGLVAFWRQGARLALLLWLAPFGFGFVAACLQAYPYGASARTMQYVTPAICLFAGLGGATLASRLAPRDLRARCFGVLFLGLATTGVVSLVVDTVRPYKTVYERNARDFARWLWTDLGHDAELACLHSDFGLTFDPRHWQLQRTSAYLCDQRIYSKRHRLGLPIDWSEISAQHPLRCVLFNEHPTDHPAFRAWLAAMKADYNLVGVREYPVNRGAVGPVWDYRDRYIVYEFVPITKAPATPGHARDDDQVHSPGARLAADHDVGPR